MTEIEAEVDSLRTFVLPIVEMIGNLAEELGFLGFGAIVLDGFGTGLDSLSVEDRLVAPDRLEAEA